MDLDGDLDADLDLNADLDADVDGVELDGDVDPALDPDAADYALDPSDMDVEVPEWFGFLQEAEYVASDVAYVDYEGDEVLTRSSVTPYLRRFALNHDMPKKSDVDCAFADVASVSSELQTAIQEVCSYGMMRGGEDNKFMPAQPLKKYELLTVIVRSVAGTVEEDTDPRYQAYIQQAKKSGIIGGEITATDWTDNVTRKELADRLYRASQIK